MRFASIFRTTAVSAAMLGLVAAPAMAAPWNATSVTTAGQAQFTQVQYRHHNRRNEPRRFERRGMNVENHAGNYYMHGHRVYRHYRHGYRRYGDWWVPPALFGLFVGSAIGAANSGYYGNSAHVRWCEDHYRSYDRRSDTYQPYNGPRRRCVSPYD